MISQVLTSSVVSNEISHMIDDIDFVKEEFNKLQKSKLLLFNRPIVQQEAHLFQQMPVIEQYYSGQEIYMLKGENFEEALASILITSKGDAVICEENEPVGYYWFGLKDEARIKIAQLEDKLEKEDEFTIR
nr:hypothetical protein [uncultured Cellulosilyticum sp.]